MKERPEQHIKTLLDNPASPVGKILARAQQIKSIDQQMKPLLDKQLALHCCVANFHNNGVLVLQTDSAAWATRLRYQTPELLTLLRRQPDLANIVSIEVIVRNTSS